MADISDVEQALVEVIASVLYPDGVGGASAVQSVVQVYRGWPPQLGLNTSLMSGVQTVSVSSDPKDTKETTRYPRVWRPGAISAPSLTLTVVGQSVVVGGSAGAGQVAGVVADGTAYALSVGAEDTPISIAAGFAAMIPGASSVGDEVAIPGAASLLARVEGVGVASVETRRQQQGFLVNLWCSSPLARDSLAGVIDRALSGIDWLRLADGSAGLLRYKSTTETDTSENAGLFQRQLTYTVEYPTLVQATSPAMMFGALSFTPADSVDVAVIPGSAAPPGPPLVGAIRFDAWYDPSDTIDQQCAAALSSGVWTSRWPPNATAEGGVLAWPAAVQATIDDEIDAAVKAGLSFWAFDSYQPGDDLSDALALYLSSSKRGLLGFCMLGQSSNWAGAAPAIYSSALDRDIAMMSQAGYVKVLGGRPLYFVLDASSQQTASLQGGVAAAIAYVRQQSIQANAGNPFIVWLSGAALADYNNTAAALAAGADAAGAYACPGTPIGAAAYSELAVLAATDWSNRAAADFPMVPTAMTGWDLRPLIETLQPFYPIAPSLSASDYYLQGEAGAVAAHVRDAVAFCVDNPQACVANVALVYAWNELAEGGWLMPTFSPTGSDTSRVSAVGASLGQWRRQFQGAGTTIS